MVQADDDERHVLKSSFASSTRPARTRSTMPESNARCQSASSLERPEARRRFPGLGRAGRAASRTQGRSPRSSRRRRCAASAGLRPPVPIATTRSARRTTDISVKEQLAGSSALFTQTRRGLARRVHRAVDRGIVGGGEREPRAVEIGGLERALGQHGAPALVRPAAHLVADLRARPPRPRRRASSSGSILRAAMRPAPTTTTRRPRTSRFTGHSGEARVVRPADSAGRSRVGARPGAPRRSW